MTLTDILKIVRQWWWVLILCPVITVAAAAAVTSSMTPIYEAEAQLLVEHQMAGGSLDLQSIQAAERRTQTFSQLILTRSVLSQVIEDLELEQPLDDLRDDLSVSHMRDTQLIAISYRDSDPEHAAEVVNAVSRQFAEYVREVQMPVVGVQADDLTELIDDLDEQIADAEERVAELEADGGPETETEQDELVALTNSIDQLNQSRDAFFSIAGVMTDFDAALGSQVYLAEPAAAPIEHVSPQLTLNLAIAGMLGLMLGGSITVVLSWLDDNVKTEADVRALLHRPVIGTVPQEKFPEQMESIHSGRSMSGEIFRGLRTNLQFTMVDRSVKSLVITSSGPGEGKTTVAANLAIVLAQGGQRVILVDADMRRPQIHNRFHRVRNDRGLSNLLLQAPAVIEDVAQSTSINNLKILTTGPLPPNPPDLIGSSRMRALIGALEETADIVIFDAPPLAISESLLLSSLADGIVFVVRAGKNRRAEIVQGFDSASQTGIPVLGVVLNGVARDSQAAHRVYQQYYPMVGGDDAMPDSSTRFGWLGRIFSRNA